MSIEFKTTIVNYPECEKFSEQRVSVCPSCKNIVVVSQQHHGPLNYCAVCGFKLVAATCEHDRSHRLLVADQISKAFKAALLEAKSSGIL